MPREGVFAKVVHEGNIAVGDEMEVLVRFRAAIVTLSDKGAEGKREDKSGTLIKELLENDGYVVDAQTLLPDNKKAIEETLIEFSDRLKVDLILTTGGTGFSPRDVMPEATLAVADRLAPGFAEVMRMESLKVTNRAMLSRAAAVLRKRTLIINMPGSPKAVRECFAAIAPAIPHGVEVLRGDANECATT